MCTRRHPPSQPSRHRQAPTRRVRLWTQRAAWAKYTAPFALRRAHQASAPAWPIIAHDSLFAVATPAHHWKIMDMEVAVRTGTARASSHQCAPTLAYARWRRLRAIPRVHTPSVCSSICSSTSVESSTNRIEYIESDPHPHRRHQPPALSPSPLRPPTPLRGVQQRERDSANATARTRQRERDVAHPSHSPSRPTIGSGRHRQWAPPIPLSRRRGHRRGRCMRRRAPRTWRA